MFLLFYFIHDHLHDDLHDFLSRRCNPARALQRRFKKSPTNHNHEINHAIHFIF